MKPNITVVKDPQNPEPIELLARSVVQVSDGMQKMLNTTPRLNERALILLLHDAIGTTKITKAQIKLVLDNLPRLKAWYVKDADKK